MLGRMLVVLCLVGTASIGQELKGDLQSVPYDLLEQYATERIDFEEFEGWSARPNALAENLHIGSTTFGTTFEGQIVNGQITGTVVGEPLAVLPLSIFPADEIRRSFLLGQRRGRANFITMRALNGVRVRALNVGGNAFSPANMLSGIKTSTNNRAITSLSPRIFEVTPSSHRDLSVVGIEPVALIFEENQTAVGFSIISLNRASQRQWVQSSSTDTSVQVKFYRRNGSLISQVSFFLEGTHHLAFARCSGAIDIAGIQITNSSETGLAFDNFIFGMPASAPSPKPEAQLSAPSDQNEVLSNPLNVDLCSLYTS